MADERELVFLALGGAGEIGMNMYLYGFGPAAERRWIVVDCGVTFGNMETSPGIELICADPAFIEAERDRIEAIFITHAHEDHVGALGLLWPRLRAPVWALPFTAANARLKLEEQGLDASVVKVADGPVEAGPFTVRFQPVTHSIPEASALVIDTPAGRLVHSGDFKIDADPQLGPAFDRAAFEEIGRAGVTAFMCDSTNVFLDGFGGSEAEVIGPLTRIMREAKGAVAATTFASNVARVRTLARIAEAEGRSIVLVGRAMRRMIETAVETGVLPDFPRVTPDDRVEDIPAGHLFFMVTGSQGEGRAALARIASDSHPAVSLGEGDTVIFSSKTIPGNESAVYQLYNMLSERGVRVIDEDTAGLDGRIHVSGHARRGDILGLYEALKPRVVVPIHGEHRHLVEHARLAVEWGAASVVAPNGAVALVSRDAPRIVEHVETGRLYLDGETLIGALDGVVRMRLRVARQGLVAAAVCVDERGELAADPDIRVVGGPEVGRRGDSPLEDLIWDEVETAMDNLPRKKRTDNDIEAAVTRAVRRVCVENWGKKPVVTVLITRLED